ncbi:flagellar hook-basal body complex protein [Neobacillus sp. 114]|uniref:flagellar hook-basal body complex protein n=1 Tax=Neobacillus sp. 114 TaxID=3048535 RepID=UPI0024C447C4|nr:flagellar hook-basal body complex protein [Neobacillus sp. 114]
MLRSLNSGVSGLRSFQTKLDVIGNNIANVNTTGFKKGRVVFEDLFSQTLRDATPPTAGSGGINPLQVGLGTKVASVQNLFTPGSPTVTNNPTDMYIDGDGFFVVKKGTEQFLTRAGNFAMDSSNQLVNPDGMILTDITGAAIQLPAGSVSYTIDANGVVTGLDGSGKSLGSQTIALATVANPSGLSKVGGSLYSESTNSGKMDISNLNGPGNQQIITGTLEMSNVDLAEEMTDMIIAQRGFQANSKIITTSDTILDELINLKR